MVLSNCFSPDSCHHHSWSLRNCLFKVVKEEMKTDSNPPIPYSMKCKCMRFTGSQIGSFLRICLIFLPFILIVRLLRLPSSFRDEQIYNQSSSFTSDLQLPVRHHKFLEVPQIVWGLNNQKIAFARAALTARFLNRTLLMPRLSSSLFYKEIDLLQPVGFDKIFQFEKFNYACSAFIRLGKVFDLNNSTEPFELHKGSGRKWTKERDLNQLRECKENPIDSHETIRIVGKNPFLWHDHWPVKDYAKIFECMVFIDEITAEASHVISKIRNVNQNSDVGLNAATSSNSHIPYVAVHMRIEKDWTIHCKNLEQRSKIFQICSNREEIMKRVSQISGIKKPTVVYLAVADSLLEDSSILTGWEEGFLPFDKKKLGVWDVYKKHPYLIQSAIDFEVCAKAGVFVGNSFSTFSSLVVLERTQKLMNMGKNKSQSCGEDVGFGSYAYNLAGESGGPRRWMTDLSDSSLHAVSYGTDQISCTDYLDR